VRKSFNMPLAYDALYFLWCKLCNNCDVLLHRFERAQRCTFYFDDISMKSSSRINQVFMIQILSSSALLSIRKLLGDGIGVGLGKP
jgi:hypothetical protein